MLKTFLNKGLKIIILLILIYTISYNISGSNNVRLLEAYGLNEAVGVDAVARKDKEEKPKPVVSNNLGTFFMLCIKSCSFRMRCIVNII